MWPFSFVIKIYGIALGMVKNDGGPHFCKGGRGQRMYSAHRNMFLSLLAKVYTRVLERSLSDSLT